MRVIRTWDVKRVLLGVPEGHKHLRAFIQLKDGEVIALQEATIAAIFRGYIEIKTHPVKEAVELLGKEIPEAERKQEFASWQLIESEEKDAKEKIKKLIELAPGS
ncbi:MAG: hypothetical protein Q6356_006660 [Candidatus Wukongarchaeota archaeon]|nr:hypothetical protein [Candidatus Wukongarchaeota archaeon]